MLLSHPTLLSDEATIYPLSLPYPSWFLRWVCSFLLSIPVHPLQSDSCCHHHVDLAPGGSQVTSSRPSSPLAGPLSSGSLLLLLPTPKCVCYSSCLLHILPNCAGASGFDLGTQMSPNGILTADCTPRLLTQAFHTLLDAFTELLCVPTSSWHPCRSCCNQLS